MVLTKHSSACGATVESFDTDEYRWVDNKGKWFSSPCQTISSLQHNIRRVCAEEQILERMSLTEGSVSKWIRYSSIGGMNGEDRHHSDFL